VHKRRRFGDSRSSRKPTGFPVGSTRTETNWLVETVASSKVSLGGGDVGTCAVTPNGLSDGTCRMEITAGSVIRPGGTEVGFAMAGAGTGAGGGGADTAGAGGGIGAGVGAGG